MGKNKKPGGKSVKAGSSNNTPLLLGVAAVAAYFLLKGSGESTPAGDNGKASAAPATLSDNWGIPHLRADTIDWANGFDEAKGQLFKALSDAYGLFVEEVDALMVFDQSQSGNSFNQVFNWYRNDNSAFAATIMGYNMANPSAPIRRRA